MSFPDLQLIQDVLAAPGTNLPNSAEATGVPVSGNNTFALPFVAAGMPADLIQPGRLKIYYDPDPGRPAGGSLSAGVTDIRFVSLSADKTEITIAFAQSAAGDCKLTVEINHTLPGHGSNTPIIVGSGSGGAAVTPPTGFTATLTPLFALVQEIGADLLNPQFNAGYSPVASETSASLTDDDGNPAQNVLGLLNPLTMPFTYQEAANGATRQWTLQAGDGVNNDSDNVTARWYPRVYWGLDANPALATEADIEGLSNSNLQGNKGLSDVLAPVLTYVYYAFPVAYAAGPLDFQFGAFPGGFIQTVASVNVTAGTPGAPVQAYQIWRSQFVQDTTISGPQPFTVQA